MEIQVLILRLKSLNELFNNYEDYRVETADMQTKFVYLENNQEYCEVFDSDTNDIINNKEDVILKPDDGETAIEENIIINKSVQNKGGNKIKEKN